MTSLQTYFRVYFVGDAYVSRKRILYANIVCSSYAETFRWQTYSVWSPMQMNNAKEWRYEYSNLTLAYR